MAAIAEDVGETEKVAVFFSCVTVINTSEASAAESFNVAERLDVEKLV